MAVLQSVRKHKSTPEECLKTHNPQHADGSMPDHTKYGGQLSSAVRSSLKSAILWMYERNFLSQRTTQRLIDAFRLWRA